MSDLVASIMVSIGRRRLLDSGREIIGPYRPFLSLKSRLHPDQSLFRLRARRTLLVEHCRYDTFLSESFVPWGTVVDCD